MRRLLNVVSVSLIVGSLTGCDRDPQAGQPAPSSSNSTLPTAPPAPEHPSSSKQPKVAASSPKETAQATTTQPSLTVKPDDMTPMVASFTKKEAAITPLGANQVVEQYVGALSNVVKILETVQTGSTAEEAAKKLATVAEQLMGLKEQMRSISPEISKAVQDTFKESLKRVSTQLAEEGKRIAADPRLLEPLREVMSKIPYLEQIVSE